MESVDKILKRQVKLVETYLFEFCEVYGIKESDLKNHLVVESCVPDNSIMVINIDDQRDVKFGVRMNVSLEVFGEFLEHKDKFLKTTKMIADDVEGINGQNVEQIK